jgi:hypothetical protein
MARRIIVEPGDRFEALVVVEELPVQRYPNGAKYRSFRLACDCGSEVRAILGHLRSGHTSSCGCSRRAYYQSVMPEYRVWQQMKQRCGNPRCRAYSRYGGRGIKVCDAWKNSFEAFISDMGLRPSDGHTIDRIDVNGDYEPSNCRWATRQEQMHNIRTNREVEFRGVKKCIGAWARHFSKHPSTLYKTKTSEGVCKILERWAALRDCENQEAFFKK